MDYINYNKKLQAVTSNDYLITVFIFKVPIESKNVWGMNWQMNFLLLYLKKLSCWFLGVNKLKDRPGTLLTLFRMGNFGAAYGGSPPSKKVCHTYPKIMRLGTVIPCLKKIQKTWHTPWVVLTSAFFNRKSANFAIARNVDIECILIHNF